MKGDFTRNTFRPDQHFTGVRMQQGRVQLDADWNEQVSIDADARRQALRDLIGRHGGPEGRAGFEITSPDGTNIHVGKGRYYVDGWQLDNENDHLNLFDMQSLSEMAGPYIFYLEVCERLVTSLEDHYLRETALGGPDTATRTQICWQVKMESEERSCVDLQNWQQARSLTTGKICARVQSPNQSSDADCLVASQNGYRGLDNRLYRVEVHQSGTAGTTFKWSRENGSTVTEWTGSFEGTVIVSNTGMDDATAFTENSWVELTSTDIGSTDLFGEPGVIEQVKSVGENSLQVNKPQAELKYFWDSLRGVRIARKWDGLITPQSGTWIDLEDGLQIQITPGYYHSGDYWLIPARARTGAEGGTIEWPQGEFQAPAGIERVWCVLATANVENYTWKITSDCRNIFPQVGKAVETKPAETITDKGCGCSTISVHTADELLEAVKQVENQKQSIEICLQPGEYILNEPLVLIGHRNARIKLVGCGMNSVILFNRPAPDKPENGDPADMGPFLLAHNFVHLENLVVESNSESPVVILTGEAIEVKECAFHSFRSWPMMVWHATSSRISKCKFKGRASVILQGDRIEFVDNRTMGKLMGGGGLVVLEGTTNLNLENNQFRQGGILLGQSISELSPFPGFPALQLQKRFDSINKSNGTGRNIPHINIQKNYESLSSIVIKGNLIRKGFDKYNHVDPISSGIEVFENSDETEKLSKLQVEINNLMIIENKIEYCSIGINLRRVNGLQIQGNQILNIGLREPIYESEDNSIQGSGIGIQLMKCEGAIIKDNRIHVDHGVGSEDTANNIQAGIFAREITGHNSSQTAMQIHGNIIYVTAGPVLQVIENGGDMIVANNYFQSDGNLSFGEQEKTKGDILSDYIDRWNDGYLAKCVHISSLDEDRINRLSFSGNQVCFTYHNEPQLNGKANFLHSRDLSVQNNQFSMIGYEDPGKQLMELNVDMDGQYVRVQGNSFIEPKGMVELSCRSNCTDGFNSATGNQAIHCIAVLSNDDPPRIINRDNLQPYDCDRPKP